jgi:hypothetical protein
VSEKRIEGEMVPDWVEPYAKWGNKIPVVRKSNHPRYPVGTRLDYGFLQSALQDGYDVQLLNAPAPISPNELCIRITDYLESGGTWNPESMEHDKVRDLLIDCRDYLAARR